MRLSLIANIRIGINRYKHSYNEEYVPLHKKATDYDISRLQTFISSVNRILVLTGAGISTESGIPDYRSEVVGLYARSGHKPVQYQQFIKCDSIRRRYWARNYLGWNRFSSFEPNNGHKCLAEWERSNKVLQICTQNVDRLHQKAGTQNIVELHGNGYVVKCLNCKYSVYRYLFQQMLYQMNNNIICDHIINDDNKIRPDGDIDIDSEFVQLFQYPSCPRCNGVLKPDIVFFGDNVPKDRVDYVYKKLDESDALLVIGSSLHVYSGYRFALSAAQSKKPIAVINIGPTRIDHFNNIHKFNRRAGDLLPQIIV